MTREQIIGIVIIAVCCWGSALYFLCLGLRARRRRTPVRFWAGIPVPRKTISDITAYNRENAKMWMLFSIPFWVSGASCMIGIVITNAWLEIACCVILLLSCTLGVWWLITVYKKIYAKYQIGKHVK